jgi:hypothetical protein
MEAEMRQHQPRCPDLPAPGRIANPDRARENSEYVRRMLGEKQPELAALLESLEAELGCPLCQVQDRGPVSGLRET